MAYVRKTRDVFEVHVDYGQGWEYAAGSYSRSEARADLRAYRANAPEYPARLVTRREPLAGAAA